MSRIFFYRRVAVVITAIVLFFIGRFYKEINEIVLSPYTIIGLLMAIIGVLIFFVNHQKIKIIKKDLYNDNQHLTNMHLHEEIRLLKNKQKRK